MTVWSFLSQERQWHSSSSTASIKKGEWTILFTRNFVIKITHSFIVYRVVDLIWFFPKSQRSQWRRRWILQKVYQGILSWTFWLHINLDLPTFTRKLRRWLSLIYHITGLWSKSSSKNQGYLPLDPLEWDQMCVCEGQEGSRRSRWVHRIEDITRIQV